MNQIWMWAALSIVAVNVALIAHVQSTALDQARRDRARVDKLVKLIAEMNRVQDIEMGAVRRLIQAFKVAAGDSVGKD